MIHVMIIAEYTSINGGENSLLAVIPDLQRRGCSFSAIVPMAAASSDGLPDAFQRHSIDLIPFDFTENGKRRPLPELRDDLRDTFRNHSPDIVHANSLSVSRIVGPICSELNQPSLGYLRDIIKLNKQVIRDLNCLDRLVAVSHATRDFHIGQGLDADRCEVIHNGVNDRNLVSRNQTIDVRGELKIESDSKLVLYVGQIGLRKGLDTWLQAAAEIAIADPQVHFLIVGERHSTKQESTEHEQQLRTSSECEVLKGRVHWLGRRNDVLSLMRQANVLLHCARQEPLGRVLLEAYDAGLPAIATDVGGTSEIFCCDPLPELMFPRDDMLEAAKRVIKLIADPSLCQQVSQTQRQVATQKFSIEQASQNLMVQYQQLLS